VAALSQLLLDRGRRFCALYADLANPTSNRIYEQIGYEPVCDVVDYRFLPALKPRR
jgi:predicted GNAT family acetyltransferase